MKKKSFYLLLILTVLISFQNAHAQSASCNSGKVDSRVAFLLQMMPDLTLEQERGLPIEARRKNGPPNLHPVPDEKIQFIKVTADSISVVIFKPDNKDNQVLPIIIDFHGGAFVTPLQPWMYSIGYDMANTFNAIVFQIDYPVAPEHKFPSAITSSYECFKWLANNGQIFGGDTSKIIISGGSAGANIAAVIPIMAKEDGIERKIKLVDLFCPVVDNPNNSIYPSYIKNAKGYGLTQNGAIWALENYTGTKFPDTSDYRLFPIHAKSLKGLPPTLIFTAEFDILRDEGEAYAKKLKAAGVPTLYRCFAGQLHTMMGLPPDATEWTQMNQDIKDFIKKYL